LAGRVILLMGPTAAGKTDLALKLVEQFDMEIISVDSAQIYRGMDIGTAKPDAATLKRAPHHLLDIRDPSESYSVAEFVQDAQHHIEDIQQRGKTPVLCGGTMLYFKAITAGLSRLPASDAAIRKALDQEAAEKGGQAMHEMLRQVDPVSAGRIHVNDSQRIQRALEVYRLTGESLTEWTRNNPPRGLDFDFLKIAVSPQDRAILHERIEARFGRMLEAGLVAEVEQLRARGDLDLERPAMRCVGYRQIWQHLEGQYSLQEARSKAIYATRQLAKRQLTWLRAIPGLRWLDPAISSEISWLIDEIFAQS